jgi:hypothetical protein
MAFIDDYKAAIENDTQFRQRLMLALSRVIINNMPPVVANPPAANSALAKRFMLNPASEVDRYLLPVAARIGINGGQLSSDADLTQAVGQVLLLNATLGVN